MPALVAYESLDAPRRAKVAALFDRLATNGPITNREKFRKLGAQKGKLGADLWEFKSFQDRFIGDFRPQGRFLVAAYELKKQDKLSVSTVERAARVLHENDAYEARSRV